MAKNKDKKITAAQPYVIQDLTLVSPDRNRKDIQNLKNSVTSAESVYYPNRVLLYDLYHDVISMDGFLKGIIEKRINSVLNKKINFLDKDGNEVEEITKLMRSNEGREVIRKIVEAELWGISGVEFKIGEKLDLEEIPRKHIKPEKGIISRSQYGMTETDGFKIDEMPFVWVIGKKNNLGLLLACSMYAIYKRGNWGDWAQYVEIFGQPVRVMYYDAYDTQTKNELKTVLQNSGTALAMMIPKQAEFEMKDGKQTNGDGKLQDAFKEACNKEMAIAILGNTETTSSSTGSGYAQSKEHAEQQDEITASDLINVENTLNSGKFFNILKSYGYDVEDGQFQYELELNLSKLKTRLEIDEKVSLKVPLADDYWYDTYGIPKPENYAELRKKMDEKASFNPTLPAQDDNKKLDKKEDPEKEDLADFSEPKFLDKFFSKLTDFFDQARR